MRDLLVGMALIPLAFIFDALDGRVARWRKSASTLGRELDSLADVISFGVAPAALGYACGLQGGWDWVVLSYFVGCGVSRLARYNVTAEPLSGDEGKVKYFEGTPIPTSLLIVGLLAVAALQGRIGADAVVRRGPARPVAAASAGADVRAVGLADDQQDAAHPEALRQTTAVALQHPRRIGCPRDHRRHVRAWPARRAATSRRWRASTGTPGATMRRGACRRRMPAAAAGAQAWHDAVDWWTQLAHGAALGSQRRGRPLQRAGAQLVRAMQQVAAQFAGQDAGGARHRRAPGSRRSARSARTRSPKCSGDARAGRSRASTSGSRTPRRSWMHGSAKAGSWLGMPAFGFAREHQERWQKLAQAQLDYQQQNSAYNALMLKASQRAYEVFEEKLAERSEPGRQLTSARALFDLWIDAAEEAYAEIALSPEFREVYGALVDAQMRVRGGVQREVEQMTGALGMPTRSESRCRAPQDRRSSNAKCASCAMRSQRRTRQSHAGDAKPADARGRAHAGAPNEPSLKTAGRQDPRPGKARAGEAGKQARQAARSAKGKRA